MARHQPIFSIIIVLLSSLFVLSTSLLPDIGQKASLDDIAQGPSTSVEVPDPVLPPEPTEGFYKFLEDCSNKITSNCVAEVYTSVVDNEKISFECCSGLIKMGLDCHIGFAKLIMEFPEERSIKSKILPKAVKAWNECLLLTGGSLSPSS